MNIKAWRIFESSGKISDYLAFKSEDDIKNVDMVNSAEAYGNADKNTGDCSQTTQHRRTR